MKEQTVFIKVPVSERLPKTEIQHGGDFLSSEVAIITSEGMRSDSYRRTYDLKGGTGKLLSEGWISYGHDITHWLEELPLPETEITEKDFHNILDEEILSIGGNGVEKCVSRMFELAQRMVLQALGRKEEEVNKLRSELITVRHENIVLESKLKAPSPSMSIEEAKATVAKKYRLGSTLVMGHKASYWEEAMRLYAESFKR